MLDVIVVGAGLAGLAAAKVLQKADLQVLVVEKSRGVGGRMAARRVESPQGPLVIDHGAQYFTTRNPEFQELIALLLQQGTVKVWLDQIATLSAEGITWPADKHTYPRYSCPTGMSAVAKYLSAGVEIHLNTKVSAVHPTDRGWSVVAHPDTVHQARAVLLTPPPDQSLALLGSLAEDPAFDPARAIDFAPCLALLAGYPPGDAGELPPGLRWEDDPVISWSALDASKRPAPTAQTFVVHTTPEFTRAHWDDDSDTLSRLILKHCASRLQPYTALPLNRPEWHQLHRWRYAMPTNPLSQAYLAVYNPAPLLLAGCWCSGARVEGAFTSGQAAAQELLRCLGAP